MDWASHYPAFAVKVAGSNVTGSEDQKEKGQAKSKQITRQVEIADIGCGYGGLLFALAPKLPDTLLVGTFTILSFHIQSPPLQSSPLFHEPHKPRPP
jgi:tRNA (guanine-N7-)-methyltransferase